VIVHVVRGIRKDHIRLYTVKQPVRILRKRCVPAQQPVVPQQDHIPRLGRRLRVLFQRRVDVKRIFGRIRFACVQLLQVFRVQVRRGDLIGGKPAQQVRQHVIIPFARDAVQPDVRLLLLLGREIDHEAWGRRISQILQHRQPLMPSDHGSGPPIPHDGVEHPQFLDRSPERLISMVVFTQFFTWIIPCFLEVRQIDFR